MKIAIDAGHGGNDTGAPGPTGLNESDVVLSIAKQVEWDLGELGYQTVMTRTSDVYIELGRRCHIANSTMCDYFVSIHCNSNGPDAVGIETLYTSNDGKALALPIQEALIAATDDRDRGLKERDDLYVLNGTDMPACLTEVGFISHPQTEQKLATRDYQFLIAQAIVEGLDTFLGYPTQLNDELK